MTTHRGNFSLGRLPVIESGDVFEDCNLMQAVPTAIGEGCSGLVVRGRANLQNTTWPPDTVFECSARPYVKHWCRNKLQEQEGYENDPLWQALPPEAEACDHVTVTHTITIDGETTTVYDYDHGVVS